MTQLRPGPKTGLVTHRGCLDGTGSALMFVWAGGLRENIIFKTPGQCDLTPKEAEPFDEVWFADLCPSSMEDPAGGRPFRVFDHHLSNQRKFGNDERCTFRMDLSGTSLMASVLGIADDPESLYTTIDDLIAALESYDLGRFDNIQGMRLADIAASYSQEELLDAMIPMDAEDILFNREWTARSEALASVRKLYAEEAARHMRIINLDGVCCGVATAPVYWKNEVASRILASGLENEAAVDVALIIDPTHQMVSLRSRPDGPDCSKIAGQYGGGGHARAAGFKIDRGQLLDAMFDVVTG